MTVVFAYDGSEEAKAAIRDIQRIINLLSKDRQVLKLRNRLARLDVLAAAALPQL